MRKSIFFLGVFLLIVGDIYSQQNEWTWMKGDSYPVSVDSSLPVYGPIGVASASYRPGKRTNPIMWASTDGTIWLFGGSGYSDIFTYGLLNDLWKYNPATNQWTWVKGDNTINNIGIYSNPNPSLNKPGGRDKGSGWVDANGDFWLFGGYGKATTATYGVLNDLWKYTIATNTWTLIKGDNIIDVTGVYSNANASLNKPGARYQPTGWRIGGNLYLFGGWGKATTATSGFLNDLWRYTIATNTWTWIKGDITTNNRGVYSNPAPLLNKPGGREQATSWVDANGVAWLFGGNGYAESGNSGFLNDLWKYDASGNTWTWVKGDNITNVLGIYGTQGVADINSKPGSRFLAAGWADNVGNLWLFGGTNQLYISGNDLWRYNILANTWTWMKGYSFGGQDGHYGTQGIPDDDNFPGARSLMTSCKDASGSFWLFGGSGKGYPLNNSNVELNELWKFNAATNQWTWVRHNNEVQVYFPGNYGVQGNPLINNKPGGKSGSSFCTEGNGNYWLFGGRGNTGSFNDLWRYNESSNTWTWMKGDSIPNRLGIYGTLSQANISNKPGSRNGSVMWKGGPDTLWLFGGYGFGNSVEGSLNDLWCYKISSNTWTWIKGDSSVNVAGVYDQAPGQNRPGGRTDAVSWTDPVGSLWLFGGTGYTNSGSGDLNDLWKYNVSTNVWTWVKGDNATYTNGVYGTKGVPNINNKPGSRNSATAWVENNNLWMFGGSGNTDYNSFGLLNDLWKYNSLTNEWTWVNGDIGSYIGGIYGTIGIPGAVNKPGSRNGSQGWNDGQGNLWLFGGDGFLFYGLGGEGKLNDLWKYNIASNQWTWTKGDNSVNNSGEYGTQGVSDPNNKPGGRKGAIPWKGSGSKIWLFGGYEYTHLNDLWKYELPCSGQLLLTPLSGTLCYSGSSVPLSVSGGTSYVWYKDGVIIPGQTGSSYTATTPGSYNVKGNVGSCLNVYSNEVFILSPTVVPGLGGTGVYCTGSIVNVGIPDTENDQDYRWLGPLSNYVPIGGGGGNQSLQFTIDALSAGTYRVESTKPGCDTVYSNYVYVGYAAVKNLTITNLCLNSASFTWDRVVPSQVTQSYQYWVSQNSSPPVNGATTPNNLGSSGGLLPSTQYYIHVRVACGFDLSSFGDWQTITFTTPPAAPTPTVSPVSATICQGSSQLLTATGGDTYQWTLNGSNINGATGNTYSATLPGTYRVYAFTNGCNQSSTVSNTSVITVTALPTGTISPASATICSGSSQLLTATGGTSYQWSRNGTPISGATAATYSATLAGTYSVVITNNGCSASASNTSVITVTALPIGTISPSSATICSGSSQLLTTTGGTSYQWSLNGTPISGATSATYTAIATGTYSVVITNGACSGPANNTSVITVTALPTGTISPANANICAGSSQLLTATGGTSYQWSLNGTPIGGATTATYTAIATGTYNVVITNGTCSGPASNTSVITVTALPTGTISPASASICAGGSQLLTATGGTSYQWSLNGTPISGATTATYTAIATGTYSVIITNGTCSGPASNTSVITVTALPTGTISPANASICTGGSQLLTATGGTSYQWSLNGSPISGATSATYTALVAGTYSVVITNGTCSGPASNTSVITFGGVPSGTITPASATICPGGSQLLTATGGTSYQWSLNGTPISGATSATYTAMAAGTYSVIITNGTCSGPASNTAVIIINTALTSTTNISICSNQLPYNWNSNSYTAAGTYNVTLISVGGCDSVATLNLTVKPLSASTTNAAVCTNQLPYVWNGNNYTITGIFNVTLVGSNGCDSIATLNLTVKPLSTSTTNITICTNQLPYSWNNNNYTAGGIYNVTLIGSNGCDSIATLNLTVNSVLTSTTNISVCTNQLPYTWNGNNYNGAGTYNVTLTSTSGCDSIATLNLTVNPVQSSTTNVSICTNQLPYSWNGNSYNGAGTYNVTLTSMAGCDSIATLNLSVNATVTSTTNATTCTNQLPFNWNGNNYNTAGTYTVILIGSSGCDSIATLNLTINPVLTSTTNVTICTTQLPYSWNGNSYTATGIYNVTLAGSNGCDSIATLNLIVNSVLTSTTNVSVCSNLLPYSWNGNNYTATGTYNVTLTSVSGCDSIATLNLTVKPVTSSNSNVIVCNNQLPYSWNGINYTSAGTYSITLIGSNGCDSVATLNLTVNFVLSSTTNVAVCINQLPYSWNGNNYTAAGTYSVTLISSTNCDSIATLNLAVNPVLASTTNATTCANQLPYSWNGNNYTAAGIYSVTLISSTNCDSIATLNLTVNPVLTSTTNATTCVNQLPYIWNNNNYTSGGVYNVTLVGSNGCDSIATLNLTVNPVLTSTTNIITCANQLPYIWNGNSYNTAGTYNITLLGSNNCDSIATLNLAVNPVLTSTTNVTVCANRLPYNWNGNNYNAAGTYNVTLTGSNNCDSIATLNLAVNPVLTSTTNATVCSNRLPYSWNGNNYNAAGTYNVTLTGSNNCDSIATLNLTVNPVLTSITNETVCASQLPYNWNGNNYTAAGSYNVTLNGSNGCDSIATLVLTVNSLPTGNISPANVTICPGATQLLTVTGGVSYQWYLNGVAINGAVSSTFTATTVGLYTAEITNANGCKANAANSAAISNFVKPVPGFAYDIYCQNQPVNFTNNSTAVNSGGVNYNWSFGDNTISSSFAPIHTYAQAGPFTVTLTATSNTCPLLADSIKKVIIINPAIPGIKYPPARVIKNVPATLSARNIGQQYTWQPSFGLSNSSISTPVVITANEQQYTIRIISTGGCITVDTLRVQVFEKSEVFVPKAFTPNSNNANDVLRPLCVNIPVINYFRVYNRWGQLVYQTQTPGEGWNGIYKNVAQPMETFTWIFEGVDANGAIIKANGKTLLIR